MTFQGSVHEREVMKSLKGDKTQGQIFMVTERHLGNYNVLFLSIISKNKKQTKIPTTILNVKETNIFENVQASQIQSTGRIHFPSVIFAVPMINFLQGYLSKVWFISEVIIILNVSTQLHPVLYSSCFIYLFLLLCSYFSHVLKPIICGLIHTIKIFQFNSYPSSGRSFIFSR